MSTNQHAETLFVGLMTELFQLDEAESLDFGIYRIIKRHNREVRDFLGEIVAEKEQRSLNGGLLSGILEKTFTSADAETTADDKYRLIQLEKDLSIKPGWKMLLAGNLIRIEANTQLKKQKELRLSTTS